MKGAEKFGLKGNEKPIGLGKDQAVFLHPTDKKKVISMKRPESRTREGQESRNFTRGRYYLAKILHLLFPENLADVHLSSSEPNATVRQKLELGEAHREIQAAMVKSGSPSPDTGFAARAAREKLPQGKIEKLSKELRNLGIWVDGAIANYGIDEEGNVQYIEVPPPFGMWLEKFKKYYDPDKLRRAIYGLDKDDQEKALAYLDRLEVLTKEESMKLSPQEESISR